MKRPKAKTVKAFAVAQDDTILLDSIEPWTDESRSSLLRNINRPAGQRVISIRITQIDS